MSQRISSPPPPPPPVNSTSRFYPPLLPLMISASRTQVEHLGKILSDLVRPWQNLVSNKSWQDLSKNLGKILPRFRQVHSCQDLANICQKQDLGKNLAKIRQVFSCQDLVSDKSWQDLSKILVKSCKIMRDLGKILPRSYQDLGRILARSYQDIQPGNSSASHGTHPQSLAQKQSPWTST